MGQVQQELGKTPHSAICFAAPSGSKACSNKLDCGTVLQDTAYLHKTVSFVLVALRHIIPLQQQACSVAAHLIDLHGTPFISV